MTHLVACVLHVSENTNSEQILSHFFMILTVFLQKKYSVCATDMCSNTALAHSKEANPKL